VGWPWLCAELRALRKGRVSHVVDIFDSDVSAFGDLISLVGELRFSSKSDHPNKPIFMSQRATHDLYLFFTSPRGLTPWTIVRSAHTINGFG